MKILVAYGPQWQISVNGEIEFNWAQENEPVNVDQIRCCTSSGCGCDRSFHGVGTGQKVSRAIVAEMTDNDFHSLCEKIYTKAMERYLLGGIPESGARKVAMYRKSCFVKVAEYVKDLSLGTIVTIKKDSKGDTYDLSHFDLNESRMAQRKE